MRSPRAASASLRPTTRSWYADHSHPTTCHATTHQLIAVRQSAISENAEKLQMGEISMCVPPISLTVRWQHP